MRRRLQKSANATCSLLVLSLVLTTLRNPARADGDAAEIRPLEIGASVEDFALRDLAGEMHRLSDFLDSRGRDAGGGGVKKAVVLAFNGIGCPIAELYAPRLEELHERYRERGVQIVGINSNRFDGVDDLRSFASGYKLTFPILKDHRNEVADQLGVERTTEVLLIDSRRKLRYRGSLDDQYTIAERSVGIRKGKPEKTFLVDALDALLAGKPIDVAQTRPSGCVISRVRRVEDATSVTFYKHIEPIVQNRCQSCHRDGEIAPFALRTYEDVAGWSGMIREVVVNRRMPPWHADPKHGEFSNDRSLPAEERQTLLRWIDNGTPAGDPADRPPAVKFPSGWTIGTPDAVFEMSDTFSIPAQGTVDYRYSVVETGLEEDRWVTAAEVQPGDAAVVHHILVFAVDPKEPRRWRRETGGGARGFFARMVPGERPEIYPPGTGKRLPAGATLVFQIHYTPNGTPTKDRSRVGFVFSQKPVQHEVHTRSAHNQIGLIVPPQARRHKVIASYRFRRPGKLLSFLPHMHLRGEAFRYELLNSVSVKVSKPPRWEKFSPVLLKRFRYDDGSLTWHGAMPDDIYEELLSTYTSPPEREAIQKLRKEGRTEILLDVPKYDFGWQNTYRLAKPLLVPKGALLVCTAHFNNSKFNPALTEEMARRPVLWGEQTWEEMLIGYFDYIYAEQKQSF